MNAMKMNPPVSNQFCVFVYTQVDADGQTLYYPRPNNNVEVYDPERQLVYNMCHFSDVVLNVTDNEGNQFTVANTGVSNVQKKTEDIVKNAEVKDEDQEQNTENAEEEKRKTEVEAREAQNELNLEAEAEEGREKGEMESSEKEEKSETVSESKPGEIIHYKQHAPRFFIVHADGSGTELLRYQDLAEYVANAEDDLATAILMDPLADYPGVMGLTILKPYLKNHSDKWLLNYAQPSIIPLGLTSRDLKTLPAEEIKKEGPQFGTNVGQGLNVGSIVRNKPLPLALKCPEKLELRQLIQFRPVTEDLRMQ